MSTRETFFILNRLWYSAIFESCNFTDGKNLNGRKCESPHNNISTNSLDRFVLPSRIT